MLELWLIRHGETGWNREGRTQGHSSNGLSAVGREQAGRLAMRLAGESFDRVHSSDLERAKATARLALPGAEILPDQRLRELGGGVLEGRLRRDFSEAERATYALAQRDMSVKRAEGGESVAELRAPVAAGSPTCPRTAASPPSRTAARSAPRCTCSWRCPRPSVCALACPTPVSPA